MPIGQPFSQIIPTPSDPVNFPGPLYATTLQSFLQEVKDRLEQTVKPSSIEINQVLNFNDFAAINASYLGLQNKGASGGVVASIEVVNGELMFVDSIGNAVQLTSNGSLNAALLSGFTGDYGLGAEEAVYTAVNTLYEFKHGAGVSDYAHIEAQDAVFNGTLFVNENAEVSDDLLVGANVTAPDFRFTGQRTITLPASLAITGSGVAADLGTDGGQVTNFTDLHFPLVLPAGSRIIEVGFTLRDGNGTDLWTYGLYRHSTLAVRTTVSEVVDNAIGDPGFLTKTISGLAHDVLQFQRYVLTIVSPSNSVDHRCSGCHVIYTRP